VIIRLLKPAPSSHRVRVEEVSEVPDRRTGFDLRSTRDLEARNSAMDRPATLTAKAIEVLGLSAVTVQAVERGNPTRG